MTIGIRIIGLLTFLCFFFPAAPRAAMNALSNSDLQSVQSSPKPPCEAQISNEDTGVEQDEPFTIDNSANLQQSQDDFSIEALLELPEYRQYVSQCRELKKICKRTNHDRLLASDGFAKLFQTFLNNCREFNRKLNTMAGDNPDTQIRAFVQAHQKHLQNADRFYRQLRLFNSGGKERPDIRSILTDIHYAEIAHNFWQENPLN